MASFAHKRASTPLPVVNLAALRNEACRACDLCGVVEGAAQSPDVHALCLPGRPWRPLDGTRWDRNRDRHDSPAIDPSNAEAGERALLIVGEAPGSQEELFGECFIGPAGQMLDFNYIRAATLPDYADVYLTNAVRCIPPQGRAPSKQHIKACFPYLNEEISALRERYSSIVILCVGAVATQSVLGLTLKKAFGRQGSEATWPCGVRTPVFSTFHPAFLLRKRSPSSINSVAEHLDLLVEFMSKGGALTKHRQPLPPIQVAPRFQAFDALPWSQGHPVLCLDIETYGAVNHQPDQTHFHPQKSISLEGVKPESLIQTVSLAYFHKGELRTAIFVWSDIEHRVALRNWLYQLWKVGGLLLCMNTLFDVAYLRYADPAFRSCLQPPVKLWDLSITSYLHWEGRPERSLKDLAHLFGVTKYEDGERLKSGHKYVGPRDPALWAYNCKDSVATLQLQGYLYDQIREDFPETAKFSAYCLHWYSNLLWSTLKVSEAGVAMNYPGLEALLDRYDSRLKKIHEWGKSNNQPMQGAGSGKAAESLLDACARAYPELVGRLEYTEKTGRISTKEVNVRLAKSLIPRRTALHRRLSLLTRFRRAQKLVSSYLIPLLYGKRKGKTYDDRSVLVRTRELGLAYPSYYLVPSGYSEAEEGGTNQGRVTAKRPALLTAPDLIRSQFTSRFSLARKWSKYPEKGRLLIADESQLEFRCAAWMSGDESILQEYQKPDSDFHTQTTKIVFGNDVVHRPDFNKFRKIGKTLNFLVLYGGGAQKFRDTLLQDSGIDLPLEECELIITRFFAAHPQLRTWQEELIASVLNKGYLELPLIGQSRWYLGDRESVLSTYHATIVNQPVQCVAANILLSAMFEIQTELEQERMRSLVVLQVYDALYVDVYPGEEEKTQKILERWMTAPPYYKDMCRLLGRTVPLKIDVKWKETHR